MEESHHMAYECDRNMNIKGIYAEPGTLISTSPKMVVQRKWRNKLMQGVVLRHADVGERATLRAPRSVAEHEMLRKIRTPYGLGRTFNVNTWGLGAAKLSWLEKLRNEKKIQIARRRNRAELAHLYRLREQLK